MTVGLGSEWTRVVARGSVPHTWSSQDPGVKCTPSQVEKCFRLESSRNCVMEKPPSTHILRVSQG